MEIRRISTKKAHELISNSFSLVIDHTRCCIYRNTTDSFFEHVIIVSKTSATCFYLIFCDEDFSDYISFVDFLIS